MTATCRFGDTFLIRVETPARVILPGTAAVTYDAADPCAVRFRVVWAMESVEFVVARTFLRTAITAAREVGTGEGAVLAYTDLDGGFRILTTTGPDVEFLLDREDVAGFLAHTETLCESGSAAEWVANWLGMQDGLMALVDGEVSS